MLRRAIALAAASSVALSACAGPASTPASSVLLAATIAASPPGATAAPTATATATVAPSPAPIAVLPGEPWIVYEGPIEGGAGNRAVRPDGTGDHWLTLEVPLPAEGWQVHPDWSPDGTRLAFAADDANEPAGVETTRDLWVANADGTEAERVVDCESPCFTTDHPAWSPDGRTLAFVGWGGIENGLPYLALLDLGTRTVRTLLVVTRDVDSYAWPRWSPDGRSLVVERQTWSDAGPTASLTATTLGIVTVGDATPAWKPITGLPAWATYPDWHPSQDLLVFSTRPWDDLDTGPSNLFTIRPDGTGVMQVTRYAEGDPRAVQPTWTPDGTRIIFTKVVGTGFGSPTMMTILPDGTRLASATSSGEMFGTHPRLRPMP